MDFGYVNWSTNTAVVDKWNEGLTQGKIMATRCTSCQKVFLPPRGHCPCGGEVEWFEMNPEAELFSYTVIMFAPESIADRAPYVVAIGQFDNGARMLAHLFANPNAIKVGMKVKLKPEQLDKDRITVKYVPV
ncbi:MAG: Zn-ribbon domain-containing OB-fold protein [Theionarchaea archaeon]|nr:Zn-ribbon domain-containing OB-fold protein [Theionarchaea archaeon]